MVREQVAVLYARLPAALLASLAAGGFLVVGLGPHLDPLRRWVWLGLLAGVLVGRGLSWEVVRRRGVTSETAPRFAVWHLLASGATGVVWGTAAWALWLPGDTAHQLLVTLVVGGMAAGAAATHASRPLGFLVFAVPALVPLALRLLTVGTRVHLVAASLLLALLVFLYAIARVGGQVIATAVRLRVENEDLLASLQARAEEREARVRALLDQAGVGILVADPFTLRVLDANPRAAQLLAQPLEHLPGQGLDTVGLLSRAPEVGAFRALLDKAREGGPLTLEDRLDREGDEVWLETIVDVRPFGDREYALLVMRDVSERRALQTQLSRSSLLASVGTLAGGTAHEINNPLSYVMGNIEYVLMRMDRISGAWPEEARTRDALGQALAGAEQIRKVVRGLGEFSRLEAGEVGPVQLEGILERCVALAQNELRHRARVEVDLAELPPVLGEPAQLSQVFLNLLLNAAQAIDPGAVQENRVAVRGWTGRGFVWVEVSDTGVGMDEQVSARVFEPFFTTRPVGKGMGLGLAVAHGIVTSLGGRIDVVGRPGAGTQATVRLPIAAEVPAVPPTPPQDTALAVERVLVVDDDPAVADALVRALGEGVAAEVLTSGKEALRRLETNGWDLVICDLMMPDLSGMELYERTTTRRPELAERFLFVTGGAFTDQARAFLERSKVPVLEKPFDRAELARLVRERARVLGGRRRAPGPRRPGQREAARREGAPPGGPPGHHPT